MSFAVAWASCRFSGYDQLVKHARKIHRAIIGTHFYRTHPEVIKQFRANPCVRFVRRHDGIFHPKVYFFENAGRDWVCLLGSANFTCGGFERNSEATLLIDTTDDPQGLLRRQLTAVLADYWKNGSRLTASGLEQYWRLWRPCEPHSETGEIELRDFLTMTWREYLEQVRRDRNHAVSKRADLLETSRKLFEEHQRFSRFSKEERQGVGGFRENNETHWGWFGSMAPARVFKRRVNENDRNLSAALDAIPLNGTVTRDDYLSFVKWFKRAFRRSDIHASRELGGTAFECSGSNRAPFRRQLRTSAVGATALCKR